MDREQFYLEIINNLRDGVYFVDTERRITFWNRAAERITGHSKEDILGQCCQDNLLNHIDADGQPLCLQGCPLYFTLTDGEQRKADVFMRHRDGHRMPISVNIFPMREGERIIGAIEIFTPNSPVVYEDTLIENLSNLAMNDPLTGLSNRRRMETYIEYRLHEMEQLDRIFCLAFLDLDGFGHFNNTYGHTAGDELLKGVAKSVLHSVRQSDLFGRWGGEEFTGVFTISDPADAAIVAEKLRFLVERTVIRHGGQELGTTASIGVTVARPGDTVESLIRRADTLMYQSKQAGKNRVTVG